MGHYFLNRQYFSTGTQNKSTQKLNIYQAKMSTQKIVPPLELYGWSTRWFLNKGCALMIFLLAVLSRFLDWNVNKCLDEVKLLANYYLPTRK